MRPLLELKDVDICYDKKQAVESVSFCVQPGEILGIVGESGSGKSTLLRAAAGLLGGSGMVTGGTIQYKDKDLLHCGQELLRKLRGPEIGMIFQDTKASLCPVRTVQAQLYECMGARRRTEREQVRKEALDYLARMHLMNGERILKSYPFELSGGMNQRVGIMLAMLQKPALLFADEPTSALDVTVQAEVVKEMKTIREQYGTAIVLVTHHMGIVEQMADRIAVMKNGRIVEYGTKEAVIQNPQHDYTKKLLDAVLRIRREG